jgi:hypothetical protein
MKRMAALQIRRSEFKLLFTSLGQQASQERKWILYFYLKKKKKAPDGKKTKKKMCN